MNLLCVIDDLGSGGAQRQLVNVACGLAGRGHRVELFTYYPADHFRPTVEAAGIRVHQFAKRGRFAVAPVRALRRLIRERQVNAVLAYLETPAVYAELACLGLRGVRLVVGERNTVPDGRVAPVRFLKGWLHRAADAVVTNSHAHRDWLAQHFPFLASRLSVVWNGIDLEVFRPAPPPAAGPGLRLLGIGRIAPAKNLPRLVQAVERCRAGGLAVTVDWVGREDDGAESRAVKAQVEAAGLTPHWRWWGERQDTAARLHDCDALVAPSLWEGLPNVVCEALASGVPVLASRVSDNARLVPDGERGLLFDPGDVEAISAAIRRFSALSADERAAMGRRGRVFAERELSLAGCVTAYERLLAEREHGA